MATRRTRQLTWTAPEAPRGARAAPFALAAAASTAREEPRTGFFASPRDEAVYLLHIGAEIEHALMAQYLYAAYSLGGPQVTDPRHQALVGDWKSKILEVAREEMGHLATVENLLTLIGGPLSFEREDYPIPDDLYPFPFELEPLTKKSLGKYVLCEMPTEEVIAKLGLTQEIAQIRRYVGAEDRVRVHRVGKVYDAIAQLFAAPSVPKEPPPEPPAFIASSDIQADSVRFQVDPAEWGLGYKDLLIETAFDRTSAINAISLISVQGEGSTIDTLETSHFGKFLDIYRHFPEEHGWPPSKKVASNPTTAAAAPLDRRITSEPARLWAGFFNLRYRMLLMSLAHSFHIESPVGLFGRTTRGLLVSWTFGEMYNLRSITEILMTLPLHDGSDVLAGPPFEMPYSLALAPREPDRWRTHRDLLLASRQYVDALSREGGAFTSYLEGLRSADTRALDQVRTIIGG